MITKDSISGQYNALMLALAVIGDRIRALPKEDREDMYELTKALFSADSEEERQSAAHAMLEIMDQGKATVVVMELSDDPDVLNKWTSFISQIPCLPDAEFRRTAKLR